MLAESEPFLRDSIDISMSIYSQHMVCGSIKREKFMANLIVRNIDETVVRALKQRASRHGVSAEAEHRKILEEVLLHPSKKMLAEVLQDIPNVGWDSDFERVNDDAPARDVFA